VARPNSGEGVNHLVVASEDVLEFKAVEFLLKLSYLLAICCHARVTTIRLPYDLVDGELRVTVDVKPLNPKLGGNAQAIDEGLISYYIVCHTEMLLNHVKELTPIGGDQNEASPCPIEGEGAIEVHAPVLLDNLGR
jgi:hypothetical protein